MSSCFIIFDAITNDIFIIPVPDFVYLYIYSAFHSISTLIRLSSFFVDSTKFSTKMIT